MKVVRDLAAVCAIGLLMATAAPGQAAAQSGLEADFDATPAKAATLTPQAEQRALAQLGLGHAFMWRLLQSQLNILDEENKHDHGAGPCKPLSDGGGIKLKSKTGTFSARAVVEIYYDKTCKDVFIHSDMTINEENSKSVSVSEKATYYDEKGKNAGTLTLKAGGAKKSALVSFAGSGTWKPPGSGALVQVALKCSYPEKLKAGQKFDCAYGIAQSFASLNLDLGVLAQLKKITVEPTGKGTFDGEFVKTNSTAQIFTAAKGKLKVSAPKDKPIGISGASKAVQTATLDGSIRLTVFWPQPNSWTVKDDQQTFTVSMLPGPDRKSAGTIVNLVPTTLATFTIDKPGAGTVTYTPTKKSKVLNWLVSE